MIKKLLNIELIRDSYQHDEDACAAPNAYLMTEFCGYWNCEECITNDDLTIDYSSLVRLWRIINEEEVG